ncbi:MAG: hypothetical protein ACTHMG_09365 [Sphingomonas sp.]
MRLIIGAIAGLSLIAVAILAVVIALGIIFPYEAPAGFTIVEMWLVLATELLLWIATSAIAAVAAMSGSWSSTWIGMALFVVLSRCWRSPPITALAPIEA